MAKLVIGTNKQTVVPAIVRDMSPAHYVEKAVDANGKLVNSTNIINLNGVTSVGNGVLTYAYGGVAFPSNTSIDLSSLMVINGSYACQNMFSEATGIMSVDLSGLTTVSGSNACENMFVSCASITSVDLSGLTTVSSDYGCSGMFRSCTNLTSVDLSSLTTISGLFGVGYLFLNCFELTSVDLSSLTTISGSSACSGMFQGCTGLTTTKFNALNTISAQISPSYAGVFSGCTKLESVEFGALTASTFASAVYQLQHLFNGTTGSQATGGCTVHFPSNFDPSNPNHTFDASTLTGYPTFGGSALYIHLAFDLPATE